MRYTMNIKILLREEARCMDPAGIFILAIAAILVISIIVSNKSRKNEKKDDQ